MIGIIGGTGGMGKGFAVRWGRTDTIMIGSRDPARAGAAAAEYTDIAKGYGPVPGITGSDNKTVAASSDILVLSIGYDNIESTCSEVLPMVPEGTLVVSPIVPMVKTDLGFEFVPIKEGKESAHAMVERHMKNPANLVSAFHAISEKKLADPGVKLDYDVFVAGEAKAAQRAGEMIRAVDGLRPLYLGSGRLAYMAEIATPLLLNIMIKNKIKNPGIKIV